MALLCGSCGTPCAASDRRCPACGRALVGGNTVATLSAGAQGQPTGHAVPQSHLVAVALVACCVLLAVGVSVWFFAFSPPGSEPHALPLILTPTSPIFDPPTVSPGALTPSATTTAVPSATATSGNEGSGGGGAPTATATLPIAATVTLAPSPSPALTRIPTPTDTSTPTPTPTPTPTNTPSSGGG